MIDLALRTVQMLGGCQHAHELLGSGGVIGKIVLKNRG
jgi:hypothetical protein